MRIDFIVFAGVGVLITGGVTTGGAVVEGRL
jgi:hypothetical protein